MPRHFITLSKYQSLGNDYFVTEDHLENPIDQVKKICNRHYGFGSDGILVYSHQNNNHIVKIHNPDGSLAEKSGNGLRILARYLWDQGKILAGRWVPILTDSGNVSVYVETTGTPVRVEMGRILPGENLQQFTKESLELKALQVIENIELYPVSLGNPHAVIFSEKPTAEEHTKLYGPLIEHHHYFANRTNVQFAFIKNSQNIQLKIWERGAGYTLSSGSSASAAAGIAHYLGLVKNTVTVDMPGGSLEVSIADDLKITQSGPVSFIGSCQFFYE